VFLTYETFSSTAAFVQRAEYFNPSKLPKRENTFLITAALMSEKESFFCQVSLHLPTGQV
jgi:hypothetical protein